jgi:hypothetical protein
MRPVGGSRESDRAHASGHSVHLPPEAATVEPSWPVTSPAVSSGTRASFNWSGRVRSVWVGARDQAWDVMKRLGLLAAVVLLVTGPLVQPLFTDAEHHRPSGRDARASNAADLDAALDATTQPSAAAAAATTQPAEVPTAPLVSFRGSDGFWRIAKDEAGVSWFVAPAGQREFLNTVTTVQPYQRGRAADGPHYISRDWTGTAHTAGDLTVWAGSTLDRVRDVGFKGLGAWSHPAFHAFDVPMTRDLNVWTWMAPDSKRLYSPGWRPTAEHAIKVQVEPLRDNRGLVGYFIDNELDWGDGGSGPSFYFDNLPVADPNRAEVVKIIRSVWSSLDDFNRDWGASLGDWAELDGWPTLPHEHPRAYGRLFAAWLSHLAEDYFRTTTTIIRQHDPNHLILGVRFKGYAPLEVVRASKDYTDAQSLNYYVSDGRLDMELFRMMHEESGGQPIMIGEYSFHSLDGRSGNRNTVGFAAQVLDQRARADGYRLFTTRLARVPHVIGADWFQWSDEPPSGRSSDGEDVNFGVVDVDDRVYEALADAIRTTTPQLNGLHGASVRDPQTDVWRESFLANKPVARVPFLPKPIRLNGELSDWPAEAKLAGVRHGQTIGLERSSLPLPNVYLGWTNEGLYLGLEVFDHDIVGAPAKGWWWTRDNVEIWLSTRPVASDQYAYDVYSHQFFFVPIDFPDANGDSGVVGQWHRPGDNLKDNLIPHPAVKDAVRVLPDRYVVEMFIPASALNGYDPASQPAMAFNIHVRNFQHATDYFWSAPKEMMTQLRPNTWGTMYLEAREKSEPYAQTMMEPLAIPAVEK